MRGVLLVIGLAACHREPKPATFNDRVLALIHEYPEHSHGGYAWPAPPGSNGTTRDLRVRDTVIAHGGDGNHCVGMTLEVYWRALEACQGGPAAALDDASALDFKRRWFVPDFGGEGAADALLAHQLGTRISLDAAQPGDFVQAWNADNSLGHSMVFLGWQRDAAGAITAMRYWSSQPWTDGIAVTETELGPDTFDRDHIYIARATCRR